MILQALKEYYDRKAADPASGIAPEGWEWKAIQFVVWINKSGQFSRFQQMTEYSNGKRSDHFFLVPSLGESKGAGIKANLFWENVEYVLGVATKPDKTKKVPLRHEAFKRAIEPYVKCGFYKPVKLFLDNLNLASIKADPLWPSVCLPQNYIVLGIDGVGIITDLPELKEEYDNIRNKGRLARCLVTGETDYIEPPLEPVLKQLYGSQKKAKLVSFNRGAFESFHKTQGYNAQIGRKAYHAYTQAINELLESRKGTNQKLSVGDATIVFWSAKKEKFEEDFDCFWAEPEKDNPDRSTEAVSTLFKSVNTGAFATDSNDTKFYVLGLSPNVARIAVCFWYTGTIAELAKNIRTYFEDLRIIHDPKEKADLPIQWLLRSLVRKPQDPRDWDKKIPPNLAGDTMRGILEGLPLPETLLQAVLVRTKAEQDVSYPRAKIIKGVLNRKWRLYNPHNERKLTMSLDKENTNVGYRLGRLFATLEYCQKKAQPGGKDMKTIRDRFYSSASSSPASVFANLMRLNKHHLAKLPAGWGHFFSNLIGEIIYQDKDEKGIKVFPARLSLDDQGQFAIGYYHQTQDFKIKKADKE